MPKSGKKRFNVRKLESAGFCMGVQRAFDQAMALNAEGNRSIYTLGPLFHNPQALGMLEKKGIRAVETPEEATGGTLIIRTHGIPPELRKKISASDITTIDLTCPRVAKVQGIIKLHSGRGYTIVIVGDLGHAEVVGLMGCAGDKGIVVSGPGRIKESELEEKVCVVAQTTQSRDIFNAVCNEISEIRPNAEIVDTLCDSTSCRQEEAREIAGEVDAMIIVGGKMSANTRRLVDVCEKAGTPAYHIEGADELDFSKFEGLSIIGVTAGASTPSWVVDEVVNVLETYDTSK